MAKSTDAQRRIAKALRKKGRVTAETECGLHQRLELGETVPVSEFKLVIHNRQFRVKRQGRTGKLELSLA